MPEWTLVLASPKGVALAELEVTPVMRWEFNRPAQISFTLDHDARNAQQLYDSLAVGLPQLRAYLDGQLKFSGRWAGMNESSDQQTSQAAVVFKSPLAMLEHRFIQATGRTYTDVDQGAIAWDLIATANSDGATGVVLLEGESTITPTVPRTITFAEYGQMLAALVQLSELDGGVTFWETPLDPTTHVLPVTPAQPDQLEGALAAFNAGPRPGVDRSSTVKFELGDGTLDNCISASRQVSYPVNRAITIGDGGLSSFSEGPASQTRYGLWAVVEKMSGATEQATLDARAHALMLPDPVQVITFEPDPTEAPRPWDDWWLGDTVSFKADADAMQIATTARVNAVEIKLDEQGNEESWKIEWGDQRPLDRVFRERLRTIVQR